MVRGNRLKVIGWKLVKLSVLSERVGKVAGQMQPLGGALSDRVAEDLPLFGAVDDGGGFENGRSLGQTFGSQDQAQE